MNLRKKICSVLGTLMISLVVASSIPLAIPKLLGYSTYNIISGSMEPELSVGTIVYVKSENPQWINENDIVAFWSNDSVIVHRAVENDQNQFQLRTKGDANAAQDFLPVDYANVIGRVKFSISGLGNLVFLYGSLTGKISLIAFLLAGGILQFLGRSSSSLINVLFCTVSILFVGALAMIFSGIRTYSLEKKEYKDLSAIYVQDVTEVSVIDQEQELEEKVCPISVDFDELQKINPDIIGWIYCEDTVINYPICHGEDDTFYLSHAYDKTTKSCGSIFLEAENYADLSDANMILYGHHMRNKSMFATLSYWAKQEYYEAHPSMWLLTPQGNYEVVLLAGYLTDAQSDTYAVYRQSGEKLEKYIESAIRKSNFNADLSEVTLNFDNDGSGDRFIVLSTCEYSFQNARYVLHGVLK